MSTFESHIQHSCDNGSGGKNLVRPFNGIFILSHRTVYSKNSGICLWKMIIKIKCDKLKFIWFYKWQIFAFDWRGTVWDIVPGRECHIKKVGTHPVLETLKNAIRFLCLINKLRVYVWSRVLENTNTQCRHDVRFSRNVLFVTRTNHIF